MLLMASANPHLVQRVLYTSSTWGQGVKSSQLVSISIVKFLRLTNLWLEVGDGRGIWWKKPPIIRQE
jgi:hypothetical protein